MPRPLLYDGRPPILPVMIWLPKVVDDDVASSDDLPYVIVPPGDPAYSSASRSYSRSPRRVAVSSGSGDGVHPASPVSMVGSEPGAMSVFSSDADLEDELSRFRPLQAPVSPVSVVASMGVMESPSRYLEPVVPSVNSAVSSSVRVSSVQDREVSSAVTIDVFPVYELSPDTSYYVPETSPVTPLSSEGLLPPLDPESLPLGAPASLNSLLVNDITLLDCDADLSLLGVPLLPLPDDLQLLPDIAPERRPVSDSRPLPSEPCSPVVSPPRDLSPDGPFDAYCKPSDTGDHSLLSAGLPVAHIE